MCLRASSRPERPCCGLELLTDNDDGLLSERTVAYRPFPALKIFRDRLIASNARRLPTDMWD